MRVSPGVEYSGGESRTGVAVTYALAEHGALPAMRSTARAPLAAESTAERASGATATVWCVCTAAVALCGAAPV